MSGNECYVQKWGQGRGSEHLSQRYSSAPGVVTCWGCYGRDSGIGRAWVKRMRALYSPAQA